MKALSGILVQLVFASLLLGQNPSVVLLRGNSTCGTGFVFNDRVITNAHLVSSLCPLTDCSDLKVEGISCAKWSVAGIKRSLDLGALACSDPIDKPGLSLSSGYSSKVSIVGFPKCGEQKISSGEIIQESRLHLTLTAKGNYGSSGSPILDSEGKLVGIVDQAASAKTLLQSKMFFQSEFPMRGVSAKNLKYLEGSELDQISHVLLDYYRNIGRTLSGIDRLLFSFDFLARIEGFNIDVVASGESPLLFGYLEQIPLNTKYPPLVFAATLEGRGPYFKPFKPLEGNIESEILSGNPNFQELYSGLKTNPYSGLELTMIKYAFILLVAVLLIGLVIGIAITSAYRFWRRKAL